jgi:hypothetical protein
MVTIIHVAVGVIDNSVWNTIKTLGVGCHSFVRLFARLRR